MPGNEFGDRVHNFFAQDSTFQGQTESQVVEGNWPVLSNNFWIGSQRQADALHSNNKTYNLKDPDIDRGQGSYPFHLTQGLNFSQSNARADFSKIQSLNEQPNLNGYMFGNQFHLSRQNEANFLAVDTDSEPHHATTSRGFSVHELQKGTGMENGARTSLRSETSVPSVSLDLFGGQQQMSHHQSSMLQPVQHQHPGINNMQQQQHQHQQQQQLMIRKMQDLQRQQQFQPLEMRQQNHINQVPAFTKQASGRHSTLIDVNPVSDLQQYPWTTEVSENWMNRGSPSMQGTQTGPVFPLNLGQTQHLVDLVPQSVDQSLYGIPVSGSRGLNANQYSHKVTDRSPMLQMSTSSNTLQGNHNFFADQVGLNDEDSIARQKFQNENMIRLTPSQSLYTEPRNMGSLQQVNSVQRNAPQDLLGRQELTIRPETPSEKFRRPAAASSNEVALDPAEEKILFGSDDNIWAAFGDTANVPGESGNLFDNGESLNGFPSIHSGSWSALMQSAVAETSSNDIVPQEEWSGLISHNVNVSSANQSSSVHNNNVKQQSSLVDDKTRMPSAPSPGSIPPSGDSNVNNVAGLNLLGHRFLNEPGQRLPNEVSERFFSLEEGNKWSNYVPPQKSVTGDSQIYRDASQNSPEAGMSAMKISSPWAHQQSGSQQQSNGRNTLVAIPTGGDRGLNVHQAEKSQNSKSNQFRVIQGEAVGGSLWKSNSVSRSATELGPVKPTIGNTGTNKVILSLNDAASVANSYSVGVTDETNPFFHNSNKINQWKNSSSSTIYQGGKDLGRTPHQAIEHNQGLDNLNSCEKEEATRHELENYDMKENSNDSHRSNLSGHTSCGFREIGSGASDSKSLPPANQKLTNQLSRKISVPRKFQYHPMGNSDEDAEPSYHLKHSTNLQAMSQSNSNLDQSSFLVQHPRNSKVNEQGQSSELQKHNKVTNEEPPHVGLPGYAPTLSISYSRPFDSFTPNTVSSSGQNMLELLPKVDHSSGHGDMMHLSSEGKVSAQLPEAEKVDGTAGFFQQNQSSIYQGFGLQLGPPSLQRGQVPDYSASSQKAQSTVNSMPISHAAAEMGEKGQQMVPTSTIQSLNFPRGEFQAEFKNNRPAVPPRYSGNDERHRNFQEAFSLGSPHVSQLRNQQVMRSSGKISMNQHVDSSVSSDVSNNIRGSMETVSPDTLGDIQKTNVMSSRGMTQRAGPNDAHERGPTSTASARDPLHASQRFSMHGISHQGSSLNALHNLTTNVYTSQHSLGSQYQKASSPFSDLTQPNTGESSSAPLTQGSMNVCKGGDLSSDLRSIYVNSPGVVDGEEQRLKESAGHTLSSIRIDTTNKNHSDNSPVDLFSTQKNIEAFGRSLKPNSFSHQNHASLSQMKTLKDAGADPSFRVSKRMKGPDDCLDVDRVALTAGQQNDRGLIVGDSLGSSTGVPSDDSWMPNFLLAADALQINPSQHGNAASQDILLRGAKESHSNSSTDYTTSVRAEYPEVSPQMAPSWFNQYGTFKNGQMLHGYNAHKLTPSMSGEVGKSPSVMDTLGSEEKGTDSPIDACQDNTTHPTSTSIFVNAPLSSGCSYELNATAQNLVVSRTKKRKTATSQLQPWHKEIADGSQNLSSLRCVAETVWSQVANCLKEKVDDDAELIEVGPSFRRSKRRLILTTQLMQQLFFPPPAAILSADASVKCENVAYAVSRAVLGNVCSAVFHSSGLDLPRDSVELLSAKGKSSEINVDRYSGKVMEGLTGRFGKLENDFLRLEKSSSIFDVRMECQDLDKFSVINRLAKFHGRGQTDISDTAPSHKPLPQRYVSAIPMPRSLPDMLQCLSL